MLLIFYSKTAEASPMLSFLEKCIFGTAMKGLLNIEKQPRIIEYICFFFYLNKIFDFTYFEFFTLRKYNYFMVNFRSINKTHIKTILSNYQQDTNSFQLRKPLDTFLR